MKKKTKAKNELNEQELGSVAGGRGSIKISPTSGYGKQVTVTANCPYELDKTLECLDTAFGDAPGCCHPLGKEYQGWVDYFVDQSTS